MKDIQNTPASICLPINTVGIKGIKMPLQINMCGNKPQATIASVDIGVDLDAMLKGTHMSRFIEVLQAFGDVLEYRSLCKLIAQTQEKLEAQSAVVTFSFTYFVDKLAPATGIEGMMGYECKLQGRGDQGKVYITLTIEVPVMTVCPCSLAISAEGAHSQRSLVRIKVNLDECINIDDIINIAESSGSSPVYTLLKRADEKYITEAAFANPTFVEDVVRNTASKLMMYKGISGFYVEVESFESIHAHNAFACIEYKFSS